MATFKGFNRSEYWSLKEINDFDSAPPIRLNNWMSKRRFDTILSHSRATSHFEKPGYRPYNNNYEYHIY
jgi:hypothetical protein